MTTLDELKARLYQLVNDAYDAFPPSKDSGSDGDAVAGVIGIAGCVVRDGKTGAFMTHILPFAVAMRAGLVQSDPIATIDPRRN
jgi:hypothetical protein